MSNFPIPETDAMNTAGMEKIQRLRAFNGSWKDFWAHYLSESCQFIKAQSGALLYRAKNDWNPVGSWKNAQFSMSADKVITSVFAKWIQENSVPTTPVFCRLSGEIDVGMTVLLIVPLLTQNPKETIIALYIVSAEEGREAQSKLDRLSLIRDVPASFQEHLNYEQAKSQVEAFATSADLLVLINRQKRFLAANMTLCNELASRFNCDRVSIGWLKEQAVSVTAISHMEKFEKKMDAVRALQASMEESLEQNCEILSPSPPDANYVARDHNEYSLSQGIHHLFSIPLQRDDEAVSVITFERSEPFTEQEQLRLRLIGDQVTQRMLDLHKWDRWFGSRCYYWFKEKVRELLNVEFTLRKALCILGVILFVWMVFGKLDYKVKAPFIVKSENVRYVPAPVEGYIKNVEIEKGDHISFGSALLTLDDRELLLEESAANAEKVRLEREIVKARSEGKLVEMRIAEAQLQQAKARLEKIDYFIERSTITAPFDGVVVEGDLKEKIGVPVQQGDLLYKIAQLDTLYSELKVNEDDINELEVDQEGHLAFASRPNDKYSVTIERIEPMAQTEEDKGNIFIVRCQFTGDLEGWWRPGMSGNAKINVGRRSPLFLLTHKTIDYLRLRFWFIP